ncbi:hypothetical protein [Arcobacter sp.]|uniref:hypothetical protein n=1 Tax=Arcobacter sp. TaxID=1872629 RepID=UPI003D14AB53
MNKHINQICQFQQKIQKFFSPLNKFQSKVNPYYNAISKIGNTYKPLFDLQSKINKGLQNYSKIFKNAIIILGEEGWFIDEEMPLSYIKKIENTIKNNKPLIKDIQKELIDYYNSNLNQIENSIIKNFPNRSQIISSAIQAHRERKYELSIPVLLTQIDGICYEKLGKYYFMKKRGSQLPQTSDYLEESIHNEFEKSISIGLTKSFPINHSIKQRKEYNNSNTFNRHQIIHGESIDYPTKINSLKAISLINYISQILSTK